VRLKTAFQNVKWPQNGKSKMEKPRERNFREERGQKF
jgi:hypothetical protein